MQGYPEGHFSEAIPTSHSATSQTQVNSQPCDFASFLSTYIKLITTISAVIMSLEGY